MVIQWDVENRLETPWTERPTWRTRISLKSFSTRDKKHYHLMASLNAYMVIRLPLTGAAAWWGGPLVERLEEVAHLEQFPSFWGRHTSDLITCFFVATLVISVAEVIYHLPHVSVRAKKLILRRARRYPTAFWADITYYLLGNIESSLS